MLFCFIYSILGMQLFGGQMGSGDDLPRNNFDTLHWSFISVFQILSGEAWNEIMYIGVAAGGWGTVVFFISWVIIGQYILLNVRSVMRRSPVGPLAHGWWRLRAAAVPGGVVGQLFQLGGGGSGSSRGHAGGPTAEKRRR